MGGTNDKFSLLRRTSRKKLWKRLLSRIKKLKEYDLLIQHSLAWHKPIKRLTYPPIKFSLFLFSLRPSGLGPLTVLETPICCKLRCELIQRNVLYISMSLNFSLLTLFIVLAGWFSGFVRIVDVSNPYFRHPSFCPPKDLDTRPSPKS